MAVERQEVHFSGRVQGVGFRFTTRELSESFAVTGFVENLPDGRVRMIAEGEAAEVDRFVAEIGRVMGSYIRDTHVDRRAALGEFADFRIRH